MYSFLPFCKDTNREISVAIPNQSFLFLVLKIIRYLLANIENNNQCSIINKIMYEKPCLKVQHLKTKNQTGMLIFPRYCTYLLIFYAIHLKLLWYGAKFTDNRQVPWNNLWFRTARPVRQNNDCIMCSCILWYKNVMHLKKTISNTMNLWF